MDGTRGHIRQMERGRRSTSLSSLFGGYYRYICIIIL